VRDYRHEYRTGKMDSENIDSDGPFLDSVRGYCNK
jgi:hypothetical protein